MVLSNMYFIYMRQTTSQTTMRNANYGRLFIRSLSLEYRHEIQNTASHSGHTAD